MVQQGAGILLITPDNQVIAMHRDDKPGIRDPGRFGLFGGAVEDNETPLVAAVRELQEETNILPKPENLQLFQVYNQRRSDPAKNDKRYAYRLHVFVLKNVDPGTLKTFEGQGIRLLKNARDADGPKVADDVREAFVDWFIHCPAV